MRTSQEHQTPEVDRIESVLKSVGRYGTRNRKRLSDRERYDPKLLIRISIVFSVVSMVLILAAIFAFFRSGGNARSSGGEMSFTPISVEKVGSDIPAGSTERLSAEGAVELVRSALESRDPALLGDFFIFGASATSPQEAIELLDHIETRDGLPNGFEYLGPKVAIGGNFEEVMVEFENAGEYVNRLAQLRLENGGWRIDLDSYARHANPGWPDILARKCDTATVRVFVTPDSYYNGGRYEEDLWKCYALISPDVDEILFGYVARGSAQEKALDRIILKEEEIHRATLEILIIREQGRTRFEISRVIADDWFIGEAHFDTLF